MSIAQTWVEYINNGGTFEISQPDVSVLDFGIFSAGQTITKYIGLRFMGNPSTNIKLWMDGAYADVYNEDGTVSYEVDITQDPYNVVIYGQIVSSPGDALSHMPDNTSPLVMSGVTANYAIEGYTLTNQILALTISVPHPSDNHHYRGLKLMLRYDTTAG